MNRRRLLLLADLLDRVPPDKFNMSTWASSHLPVMRRRPRCASAACALGWATTIPEFGLELVANVGSCTGTVRCIDNHSASELYAACRTFGINYRTADKLFMEGFAMTPKGKARQIRRLVCTGHVS